MKENFAVLDGLRGISALYVLIHHARLLLTQSYNQGLNLYPEKYEWLDKLMVYFFGLFKFGHEAVIVFFVLSGFLIHLRQASPTFDFRKFKILSYLEKRVLRIYPTLLTSFLLCLGCDYIIYVFTDNSFISVFSKYNLYSFISNIFLIPNDSVWGVNFPMWSLKHEWFFYMLYPLLLWLAQKHIYYSLFVVFGLFISYIFGFQIPLVGSAAYTLMVWSLGCFLAEIYQRKKLTLLKVLPYFMLLIIFYFFLYQKTSYYPLLDVTFGFVVMGVLAYFITNKKNIVSWILTKMEWLGKFSFSLYLLHWPIFHLYRTILLFYQKTDQLPYHLWHVVLSICISIPIIYLIYYYTERIAINYKERI